MRVLVDTHAFFWWVVDNPKLSRRAREVMADEENEVFISAVVVWEITSKWRRGWWAAAMPIATDIAGVITANNLTPLAITVEHARVAGLLHGPHCDPFDRMLAAQAQVENMPLLTADAAFRNFGTAVMW